MTNPVLTLLKGRFAGRSIAGEALPEPIIQELIEAARLTPSCFNKQPWRFLFLEGEALREHGPAILAEGNRIWATRAPLLIVGYSRAADDCQIADGREYHQFDLGMAVMNILLAATHHGFAARPMAGFSPDEITKRFSLAAEDRPMVVVAVGYTSEDEDHLPEHYRGKAKAPRERRSADEIVRRIR